MPFDEGGCGPQHNTAAAAVAARGGLLANDAEEEAASRSGAGSRDAEFEHDFDFGQDMDVDIEELPSALTLLANLDVLSALDEEVTDSRLPFPQAEEDEETARLMQVSVICGVYEYGRGMHEYIRGIRKVWGQSSGSTASKACGYCRGI